MKPNDDDREHVRAHVADNRLALRVAHEGIVRACRGLLVGDVALGMDPGADPERAWWARVTLHNGTRKGHEVLVENHPTGLAALDALGQRIGRMVGTARASRRLRN